MTYVEWLRVRNALKWTTIVLGLLLLIAVVLRVVLAIGGKQDALAFVGAMQSDQHSRVVHSTLPDGSNRTTIDNPVSGVHVVVDDLGYDGKHIRIEEPSGGKSARSNVIAFGSVSIDTSNEGNRKVTTIVTDRPEPFALYAGFAVFVALIVATNLAAPFARENDGHLEYALTKPIGRVPLALSTIGVDLAGLLAAWAIGVVFLILGHAVFEIPRLTFGPDGLIRIFLGLLGVVAWYAMLCAATSSMRRGYGAILGLAWPVSFGIIGVALVHPATDIGRALHAAIMPFAWLNPLYYMHFGPLFRMGRGQAAVAVLSSSDGAWALLALTVAYLALAIWQWNRVEA